MRKLTLNKNTADFVLDCLYSAMRHRCNSGIDQKILEGASLREGEYSCEELEAFGKLAPYLNIIEIKSHDFEAAFSDIQFSIAAKPFVIKPSTKPTISRKAKREAAFSVFNEVQAKLAETGGSVSKSDLLEIMVSKKTTLVREVKALADKGTAELEKRVYDKFEESNWQETYAEFIQDIPTNPTAFIKGPVAVNKERRQWVGQSVVKIKTPTIQFFRLDPRFVFPSPGAKDCQTCEYIIEVAPATARTLSELLLDPSAKKPAVKKIIEDFYSEADVSNTFDWYRDNDELGKIPDSIFYSVATDKRAPSDQTYIVKYYGGLLGMQLSSLGVKNVEKFEHYEAEVWVIGNEVVKAVLKDGVARPINGSSFRKVPGKIWGRDVVDLLKDAQRSINGFYRATHKNAEWVADPLKEIFDRAFNHGEEPDDVFPGDVVHPISNPYQKETPSVRLTYGKSALTELFNTLMNIYRLADELVGIQSQITGSADMASVNRTASVYVASANNALKKIKLVARNIDLGVIMPIVNSMVDFEMINNPKGLYRSDVNAVPSGSSGIVEKEVVSSQIGIILQTITSMVPMDDPDNPRAKELFYAVFRQFLESHGFDAGPLIPEPGKPERVVRPDTTQPGTPAIALDGRSQAQAQTTIQPTTQQQLEAA